MAERKQTLMTTRKPLRRDAGRKPMCSHAKTASAIGEANPVTAWLAESDRTPFRKAVR